MEFGKSIRIIHCHAGGEVGDVIVDGVASPPGETLWEQSRWIASDDSLRRFVLNEPRGGVFRHVNLLVPPKNPMAQMGFIIMEPEDTPPMSGSNSICVATVLLETGILEMKEPLTKLILEAPGGLVNVTAECRSGKVLHVTVENHLSFVDRMDVKLDVEGIGIVSVDTAYGGDSFVIVDASAFGLLISPINAQKIAELGVRISCAATEQIGFCHPENSEWDHISFCLFADPVSWKNGCAITRHAVAIRPGKIDRSPTGTGISAHMALLYAKGEMQVGAEMHARSIIDSEFMGRIVCSDVVGDRKAIRPSIRGRAWLLGESTLRLDPTDPWPEGYRISDTWPLI